MTYQDLGVTGAKRQSWRKVSPREMLKRLMDENPSSSPDDLLKRFSEYAMDNEDCLNVLIEYWFTNNYRSLRPERPRDVKAGRVATEKKTVTAKKEIVRKIEAKAEIMLLSLMLPHGKTLQDSTGKECATLAQKVGPWLGRIAGAVKPTQKVGAVLSEADVRKMWSA